MKEVNPDRMGKLTRDTSICRPRELTMHRFSARHRVQSLAGETHCLESLSFVSGYS
jgi:hypothetical protein